MSTELENGYYHLYNPTEEEPVLVHLYDNPDGKCKGFGFNTSDGGGFLPLHDLIDESKAVKVEIVEKE